MNLETRVGKATISVIVQELKEYIKTHTKNHKYIGEFHYLTQYKQLSQELTK